LNTINKLIKQALEEDLGDGDHSSLASIPLEKKGGAKLLVKDRGIIAGVEIASLIFKQVDLNCQLSFNFRDGDFVQNGDVVFTVEGSMHSILKAERLVLNFMQRMSGIATHTNHLTHLLQGLPTKLLDTRKTTPNFRLFEKMAVKIGGGENHRFGLYDMIMLKDNHIDFAGGIAAAIEQAREYIRNKELDLKLEVEARNLKEVKEILRVGQVDRIMLDNFNYSDLKKAVELIGNQAETEASGGIDEDTILEYAQCGVDYISVGALTHQIKSLDLSLKAISWLKS